MTKETPQFDNRDYDPSEFPGGVIGVDPTQRVSIYGGFHIPRAPEWVQMVVENRDGPEEVRPFLIVKVLDAKRGIVNGMLFLDDGDMKEANPGVLGMAMSRAIRECGFEAPSSARGVFWLGRVHFHPQGIQRQQTSRRVRQIEDLDNLGFRKDEVYEEPLWDGVGEDRTPLLESTWRWPQ